MHNLPFFHSYNPATKHLTLRGASYFPSEVFAWADEIEILDVSQGTLTHLPADFARLHKLRIAFFSHNQFTAIPAVLGECTQLTMLGFRSCRLTTIPEQALPAGLRWLTLTHNAITRLPESIGQLTHLQKLLLAGNQLADLPQSMVACRSLELIRLAANQLTQLPDWLLQLPRLAWYGDSGNPGSLPYDTTKQTLPDIDWSNIQCGEMIGESPSSAVFKGVLTSTQQAVAIKLYKAELASDGRPLDDMHLALAAGAHDNLMRVIGKLTNHPEQAIGLVLGLVPSSYHCLGLPPSWATCTRDTYPANTVFTLPYILRVLRGIALACQQLHSRGIMHGDLYAHNILTSQSGHALLGDFGAASLYTPHNVCEREQIDVRAFGCLMEDLLSRCVDGSAPDEFLTLRDLQDACLSEHNNERPCFRDITQILTKLIG